MYNYKIFVFAFLFLATSCQNHFLDDFHESSIWSVCDAQGSSFVEGTFEGNPFRYVAGVDEYVSIFGTTSFFYTSGPRVTVDQQGNLSEGSSHGVWEITFRPPSWTEKNPEVRKEPQWMIMTPSLKGGEDKYIAFRKYIQGVGELPLASDSVSIEEGFQIGLGIPEDDGKGYFYSGNINQEESYLRVVELIETYNPETEQDEIDITFEFSTHLSYIGSPKREYYYGQVVDGRFRTQFQLPAEE